MCPCTAQVKDCGALTSLFLLFEDYLGETELAAGAYLDGSHRIVHLLYVYLHHFGGSWLVKLKDVLFVRLATRIIKGLLPSNEVVVVGVAHDVCQVVRDDCFLTKLVVDAGV